MVDRLRVLHVVPYFPPDRIGGVGEVAANLHRALLAGGHDSKVLTSGTTNSDARIRRFAKSPFSFVARSAFQTDLLRDCDLIHCHHGECLGLLAMNRLRAFNVPVLCTFHCSCAGIGNAHRSYRVNGRRFRANRRALIERFIRSPARHLMDLTALRLADEVNFISRQGATDILGASRGATARVVYNGLPKLPAETDPDGRDTSDRGSAELLYVGTASHRKRINVLPFVLRAVSAQLPSVRLRVIGFEPHDQPEFVRLSKSLDVFDNIDFAGRKLSSELPQYYGASKVLLVPSAYEGLPMVILEAAQCGLPCVATRVSGHPEAIEDGINGFLVTLDDAAQMADRCLQLLRSPELCKQMTQAAQSRIRTQFTLNNQVQQYLELYESITNAAGEC